MENRDKAINLFKYIMELYAQKYQEVSDIENQEWIKSCYYRKYYFNTHK